jgi:predicted Zn finger-like uncharacterized protein
VPVNRGNIEFHRIPPEGDTGKVRCEVCGHTWVTTPDQDALLVEVLTHEHDRPAQGTAPSSIDPPISTR